MKVMFFAYIRDYTGTREINFEYCKTVEELLHKLCEKYGKGLSSKIFKGEELSGEIIILVSGRNITHLNGIKTPLCEEDIISIFPVVAGG
jgi:sulfur-carrier protein